MDYTHRFRVRAPRQAVADFHAQSASLPAITPFPIIVRVHRAPERLAAGEEMDFTLWAGPLPLHWVAHIDDSSLDGFTDRQVRGPFARWQHRHRFIAVSENETEVLDEVTAYLSRQPFRWLVGALMWVGLPALFAFRARRTKHVIEQTE